MRIAIIGSGISGLVCAYKLNPNHDIHLFEQGDYLGGHTNTEYCETDGQTFAVNTGFIVYNNWTYPNLIALFNQLGVETEASSMSFSVKNHKNGLEYNGTSINTLFAQRKNFLNPRFLIMIKDIIRFNKEAKALLLQGRVNPHLSLSKFLKERNFSPYFIENYIIPMGAAIWSATEESMQSFPFYFFIQFFNNHGMLNIDNRPTWRVVSGGSAEYVKKIEPHLNGKYSLNTKIERIERDQTGVTLYHHEGKLGQFDKVIIATHSDQALNMLAAPTNLEKQVLGAIPYQENDVLLHTDTSVLPKNKLAWASWNYEIPTSLQEGVRVHYNMNILQNFQSKNTFCVSLNSNAQIDASKVIKAFTYHHPVFSAESLKAQELFEQISGQNHTFYCGAYWFNGFHEDGVRSGLRVCEQLKGETDSSIHTMESLYAK